MRKILSVIAALMLAASLNAHAQLTISPGGEAPEKVATLSPMSVWIYFHQDKFFLVVSSSNRFDPGYWLDLGDHETAGQTARDLLDALTAAKNGDQIRVESQGDILLLTKDTFMGSQRWVISPVETRNVYAGLGYLEAVVLRKAVKNL